MIDDISTYAPYVRASWNNAGEYICSLAFHKPIPNSVTVNAITRSLDEYIKQSINATYGNCLHYNRVWTITFSEKDDFLTIKMAISAINAGQN